MKHGRIAFITTEEYRNLHLSELKDFIFSFYFFMLCEHFTVVCTGRTCDLIAELVGSASTTDFTPEQLARMDIREATDLDRWRNKIIANLERKQPSVPGMIEIIYELVEDRIDAVLHFGDFTDVQAKPDSNALARQAMVHNKAIAHDPCTARAFIASWVSKVVANPEIKLFLPKPDQSRSPLAGLKDADRGIALIAHDDKKLDMLCFVAEHLPRILKDFDFILATATTGLWIQRLMQALGRQGELHKLRLCKSGNHGGDIQIGFAVVKRYCRKVIFLQDPFRSQAHEPDIYLFEQAVLKGIEIELAKNVESARALLEQPGVPHAMAA